jgi:hypothetical protein
MQDTAMRELDEAAAPAFVNGVAADGRHRPARAPARTAKPTARPVGRSAASPAPTEGGFSLPWPAGLAALLAFHQDWHQRMARAAQAQLAFVAEASGELLATGHALAAEADPARRLELTWHQALRQLEHAMAASSRLLEDLGGVGGSGRPAARDPHPG